MGLNGARGFCRPTLQPRICAVLGVALHQIQYDPDEWDYLLRTSIREGSLISTAALWVGMILQPFKTTYDVSFDPNNIAAYLKTTKR